MHSFDAALHALHYVRQYPLNRLYPLLQVDPELETLPHMKPSQLAYYFQITLKQAIQLHAEFHQVYQTDWHAFYAKQQIVPIPFYNEHYPISLLNVYDPPAMLYCKGDITLLQKYKKIAIVGSRKATNYSQKCLTAIIPPLISQNIAIVSGLARGADRMAHETTIAHLGNTIAVLGNGLHYHYPREHKTLQLEMEKKHLVLTEYPPHMPPQKWQFPKRNRIISGLSEGIVLTEAELKSGTMSTVEYGLDHGRNIFSVPGDIFSPLSAGPNKLIYEGATPVLHGQQIIEEMKNNSSRK